MSDHNWVKSDGKSCGVCMNYWSGESGPGVLFPNSNYCCSKCSLETHASCREMAGLVHRRCSGGSKLKLLHLQPPSDTVIEAVKAQKGMFCIRLLSINLDMKNKQTKEEMKGAYLYGILNIPGVDGVIKTDVSKPVDGDGNCSYSQNKDNAYYFAYNGGGKGGGKDPSLHLELWKAVMVILDSCLGLEDISLVPVLLSPNVDITRKFFIGTKRGGSGDRGGDRRDLVGSAMLSMTFVPKASSSATTTTASASASATPKRDGTISLIEGGARAAPMTESKSEDGDLLVATPMGGAPGTPSGILKASPADSSGSRRDHLSALKMDLGSSYDALDAGAGYGVRRRRLPQRADQPQQQQQQRVLGSGSNESTPVKVSPSDTGSSQTASPSSGSKRPPSGTASATVASAGEDAVSWALRGLWSASEAVYEIGASTASVAAGGGVAAAEKLQLVGPSQDTDVMNKGGRGIILNSGGATAPGKDAEKQKKRELALSKSRLAHNSVGKVSVVVNSVYRTDVNDALHGSYYVLVGMEDDDKDDDGDGVHWMKTQSVFHSASPQFNKTFSFPARHYCSVLNLSLYDAISHRKIGQARQSVYRIQDWHATSTGYLRPLIDWTETDQSREYLSRHLPLRDPSDPEVLHGYFDVRVAFTERNTDLFLRGLTHSGSPVVAPEREQEALSVERLTLHIARFQQIIAIVNFWSEELGRLLSWERPVFTLAVFILFVATTLYLEAEYFLCVPLGLLLVLFTHALYRRHTHRYRTYWVSRGAAPEQQGERRRPVGIVRVAVADYLPSSDSPPSAATPAGAPETRQGRQQSGSVDSAQEGRDRDRSRSKGRADSFETFDYSEPYSAAAAAASSGGDVDGAAEVKRVEGGEVCYKIAYVPVSEVSVAGGAGADEGGSGGGAGAPTDSGYTEGEEVGGADSMNKAPASAHDTGSSSFTHSDSSAAAGGVDGSGSSSRSGSAGEEAARKEYIIGFWGKGARATGKEILSSGNKQFTRLMESLHILSDRSPMRDDILQNTLDADENGDIGFVYPILQPLAKRSDGYGGEQSAGAASTDPEMSLVPWEQNEDSLLISLFDGSAVSGAGATSAAIISANRDAPFATCTCKIREIIEWAFSHQRESYENEGGDYAGIGSDEEWSTMRRDAEDRGTIVQISRWFAAMAPRAGARGGAKDSTTSSSSAPLSSTAVPAARVKLQIELYFRDTPTNDTEAAQEEEDAEGAEVEVAEAALVAATAAGASHAVSVGAVDGEEGVGISRTRSRSASTGNSAYKEKQFDRSGAVHSRWLAAALLDSLSERASSRGGTIETLWNMPENIKYVQNLMAWLLDVVESSKNLFNWSSPRKTWPLYLLLVAAFVLTLVVKGRYIILAIGVSQFGAALFSGPSNGKPSATGTVISNLLHSIPNDDDLENDVYYWERKSYKATCDDSRKRYIGMARLNLSLPCLWAQTVELKISGMVSTVTAGADGKKQYSPSQLNTPWSSVYLAVQGRRIVWWLREEDVEDCRAHEGQLLLCRQSGITQVSPVDLRDSRFASKSKQLVAIFACDVDGTYLKASIVTGSAEAAEALTRCVETMLRTDDDEKRE